MKQCLVHFNVLDQQIIPLYEVYGALNSKENLEKAVYTEKKTNNEDIEWHYWHYYIGISSQFKKH